MERELKKQQREEEQRLNAEANRAKKEAAKAEKKATREQSKKCLTRTKRSSPRDPQSLHMSKKVQKGVEAEEDADHCCVCFGSYQEDIETGRECIQCYITRWLQKDCVDEEDIDPSGKLCPLVDRVQCY